MTTGLDRIKSIVERAVATGDKYPISLDEVWGALGYATKGSAVRTLSKLSESMFGVINTC